MDLSFLMAAGPVSIDSHATQTFVCALVTGNTVDELRRQANAARQQYNPRPGSPVNSVAMIPSGTRLYPNPLPQGEELHLALPTDARANIRFYNILGQQVAELTNLRSGPQGVTLHRESLNQATGLLFYRIESDAGRVTGKLLVLR
jgi:hypothetical protein